jgi:MoaA/NifB/PqqE/SkfB family radical SAM enzyme
MASERHTRRYIRGMAKKFSLFKTAAAGRPTWCSWQLTDRCNFRCRFCSAWQRPPGTEQTLEQIEHSARNLTRIGTMVVSMTGGEPLMRRDLPEIVRAVGRYHFTFVSTNGSLVTESRARDLAAAGLWGVGVSLDYADAERHDAARGHPGAHRRAVEALRILQAARIGKRPQVNMMITLMRDNFDDLPLLARLAADIGCSFRVQPYSTLKTGDRGLIYPHPVSARLRALQRRYPNFITNPVALKKFDQALTEGVPGCVAGRFMLNIDPRGRVAKCPEDQAHPVGHILTDDARTLLARLREKHRINTCRDCWYNCRNEIEVSYTFRGMFHGGRRNFRGR